MHQHTPTCTRPLPLRPDDMCQICDPSIADIAEVIVWLERDYGLVVERQGDGLDYRYCLLRNGSEVGTGRTYDATLELAEEYSQTLNGRRCPRCWEAIDRTHIHEAASLDDPLRKPIENLLSLASQIWPTTPYTDALNLLWSQIQPYDDGCFLCGEFSPLVDHRTAGCPQLTDDTADPEALGLALWNAYQSDRTVFLMHLSEASEDMRERWLFLMSDASARYLASCFQRALAADAAPEPGRVSDATLFTSLLDHETADQDALVLA